MKEVPWKTWPLPSASIAELPPDRNIPEDHIPYNQILGSLQSLSQQKRSVPTATSQGVLRHADKTAAGHTALSHTC